jgi:hypothetical protein
MRSQDAVEGRLKMSRIENGTKQNADLNFLGPRTGSYLILNFFY